MKRLSMAAVSAAVFASIVSGLAVPQASHQEPPGPANAWMKFPSPYSARSAGVTESVRAERDRFWYNLIGDSERLTGEKTTATMSTSGDLGPGPHPEIPEVPNRAILTATFLNYRSILTASERAIYTDITFRVHKVFEDRTGHAVPDEDITVSLGGGTVIAPSGQVVSFRTEPFELFLQPGKTYLLVLSYLSAGDFYAFMFEDWDISDGTVRPNFESGIQRAKAGRSFLSGLTTDQLDRALTEFLSKR